MSKGYGTKPRFWFFLFAVLAVLGAVLYMAQQRYLDRQQERKERIAVMAAVVLHFLIALQEQTAGLFQKTADLFPGLFDVAYHGGSGRHPDGDGSVHGADMLRKGENHPPGYQAKQYFYFQAWILQAG